MKNDAGEPTLNSTILERMFHLWKLRLLLVAAVVHIVASTDDEFSMYPTHIRKERLRRDENGKNVETGKLESIGGISKFTLSPDGKWIDDKSKKVTYSEFKKRLQCSPSEPGLNIHGTISLIRELVPLDDQVFEIACAFAESSEQCTEFWGRFDWDRCTKFSVELKGGKVSSDRRKNRNPNVRLIRVINGRLYYDWPWKPLEKPDYESQWGILRLLGGALEKISDMKDSVFISTSFDFPLLPPNVPVPSLSHGPKIHNSDIPFPWTLLVNDEIVHYQSTISAVKNFIGKDLHSDFQTKSIDMDLNPDNDTIWLARENKAAHHGTLWFTKESVARQIVMDLAVKRPDMIAANWTKSLGSQVYYPRKPGDSRGYDLDTYLAGVQDSKLTREIPLIQYMARWVQVCWRAVACLRMFFSGLTENA